MSAEPNASNGTVYLRPLGPMSQPREDTGFVQLAGGPLGFAACEVIRRAASGGIGREVLAVDTLVGALRARDSVFGAAAEDRLLQLSRPRPAFAGLAMDRPRLMGVINVTPDSFSDGGERFDPGRAVADGLDMRAAGAELLDVGGESTRPGAEPVDVEEELRRAVPVVRGLAAEGATVSIDSRHARVMAAALDAGAAVINDVTALAGDPESLNLAARTGVPVILMHMQGEPRSMQDDPRYADAALDVFDVLAERVAACEAAGIPLDRIAVDPGIGFGKTLRHNLEILDQMALFHGLGCVLLLGVSRKGFIGRLAGGAPPKARLPGSLAAALAGVARGVQILRVHDVAETVQALQVWQAIGSVGTAVDSEH